jgi:hypothetical protein
VMIQLIDQSNPAQGLVYRCLGCLAEFISAPPLLDEHQCGKPDDDPKRGIRPYVRVAKIPVQFAAVDAQAAAALIGANAEKIEAAVSESARKARRPSRGKKTAETLAITAPPENLHAEKPKRKRATPVDS